MFDLIHSVDSRKLLDEIEKGRYKARQGTRRIIASQCSSRSLQNGHVRRGVSRDSRLCKDIALMYVYGA